MANLIKWAGERVNLTIANKAKNNTGISYVTGTAYFSTLLNSGSVYTYELFTTNKVNSVTNSNEGSTSASVAVFNTKTMDTLPAYSSGSVTFQPEFTVKWINGGETDSIRPSSAIDIHYPATELKSNIVAGTYIYSNDRISCTVWAHMNFA